MSKQWQTRVYKERSDLKVKYIALGHFLDTAQNIEEEQMAMLRKQYDIMHQYLRILDKRIDSWQR